MAGQHAYLPPSAADIWGQCSAFGMMNAENPHGLQMDTDATEEGTLAHEGLAAALTGQPAPLGMPREMQDAVEFAVNAIASVPRDGVSMAVERTLPPCDWLGPDVWGTPDVRFWGVVGYTLDVIDFKYGHRHVPALGNQQLATYAILALEEQAKSSGVPVSILDQHVTCNLTIIQPRDYGHDPVRTWTVKASDLRADGNRLAAMAAEARSKPTARPGLHCRYCPGILACEAGLRAVQGAVDIAHAPASIERPSPLQLAHRLSVVSKAAQMIDAELKALETHGLIMLEQGQTLPGWHIGHGQARTGWDLPDDQVLAIGKVLGADLSKQVPITPAQAAKAGVNKAIIDQLTRRKSGEARIEQDATTINYLFSK